MALLKMDDTQSPESAWSWNVLNWFVRACVFILRIYARTKQIPYNTVMLYYRAGIIRFCLLYKPFLDPITITMIWPWPIEGTIVIRLCIFMTFLYCVVPLVCLSVPRDYCRLPAIPKNAVFEIDIAKGIGVNILYNPEPPLTSFHFPSRCSGFTRLIFADF